MTFVSWIQKKISAVLFSRWGLFLFFVIVFFLIIGVFSSVKTSLEKIWPIDIFVKKPISQVIEKPIVYYPSQEITIETPFSDPLLVIKEPIFPDRICSITDYGAVADGKTLNTGAFQKAIDDCATQGGGKVNVSAGTWLTGAIHLKSNIELHIERDATILFSTNPKDYLPVVFSRFEGIEYYNYSPPIYTADSTNVAITGVGTLNGQGSIRWWKMTNNATFSINKLYEMGDDNISLSERTFGTETAGLRPAFIEFVHCSNVLVQDVKIVDGPMWTVHPIYSNNVIIRGVDIDTDPGPSTDGVAIDSSSNVLIENSTFATGDDAIVLKSGRDKEGIRLHIPTENVVIRNNTIKEAHGAIAIGSEMSGDVRNVFASNNSANSVQFGFRVKATKGRGGIVENIWVEGMKLRSVSIGAIQITTAYGLSFGIDSTAVPLFRNIHLKDFAVEKTRQTINVDGLEELPVNNISFENMTFFTTRDGAELSNTDSINFQNINITFKFKDNPLFSITDSTNIDIYKVPCPLNTLNCLLLNGKKSSNINIHESGFETETKKIKTLLGTSANAIIY